MGRRGVSAAGAAVALGHSWKLPSLRRQGDVLEHRKHTARRIGSTIAIAQSAMVESIDAMKVTIVFHESPPPGSAEEIHRFHFQTSDGTSLRKKHSISLRTARVIVESNPPDDALTRMLRAIVSVDSGDYDDLVGTTYTDDDAPHAVPHSGRRRKRNEGRVS
jgi:hypothetical protein